MIDIIVGCFFQLIGMLQYSFDLQLLYIMLNFGNIF